MYAIPYKFFGNFLTVAVCLLSVMVKRINLISKRFSCIVQNLVLHDSLLKFIVAFLYFCRFSSF